MKPGFWVSWWHLGRLEKAYFDTDEESNATYSRKTGPVGDQFAGSEDLSEDRSKNCAKTFPGIAKAMAEQWGELENEVL